jgi:hypothetical protein
MDRPARTRDDSMPHPALGSAPLAHSQLDSRARQRRWGAAILWAGLAAGVLDGTAASLSYGAPAQRIFQSVASGLLGREALDGGWATASMGIGLHFLIATAAAATYVAASSRMPVLVRRPWLFGPAFGIAVYFFMQHVVVPLSAASQAPFSVARLGKGLLIHVLCVGLPIALCARRFVPPPDRG